MGAGIPAHDTSPWGGFWLAGLSLSLSWGFICFVCLFVFSPVVYMFEVVVVVLDVDVVVVGTAVLPCME